MDIEKQNKTIVADPVISGLDATIETGLENTNKLKEEKNKPEKKPTPEEIEAAKKIAKESRDVQEITNLENRTFLDKEDQY